MKKIKGFFTTILVIVFMISIISSCSSDEETNNDGVTYSELSKNYKGISGKISKSVAKIQSVSLKSKKNGNVEITQELIDQYAKELDYQAGEFDVQIVKDIIAERNRTEILGFETVVESKGLSTFAKRKIIELSNGIVLTETEINEEFMNLSSSEKEVIAFGNVYVEEVISKKGTYSESARSGCSTNTALGNLLLGALAGELICGPPCAAGGAIVGYVLCEVLK